MKRTIASSISGLKVSRYEPAFVTMHTLKRKEAVTTILIDCMPLARHDPQNAARRHFNPLRAPRRFAAAVRTVAQVKR